MRQTINFGEPICDVQCHGSWVVVAHTTHVKCFDSAMSLQLNSPLSEIKTPEFTNRGSIQSAVPLTKDATTLCLLTPSANIKGEALLTRLSTNVRPNRTIIITGFQGQSYSQCSLAADANFAAFSSEDGITYHVVDLKLNRVIKTILRGNTPSPAHSLCLTRDGEFAGQLYLTLVTGTKSVHVYSVPTATTTDEKAHLRI